MSYIAMGQELLPTNLRRPISSIARPVSRPSAPISMRSSILDTLEASNLTRENSVFYSRRVSNFVDSHRVSAVVDNQEVGAVLEARRESENRNEANVEHSTSADQAKSPTELDHTGSGPLGGSVQEPAGTIDNGAMSDDVIRASHLFDQDVKNGSFIPPEDLEFYNDRARKAVHRNYKFSPEADDLAIPLDTLATTKVTVEHTDAATFEQGGFNGQSETTTKIWADGPDAVSPVDGHKHRGLESSGSGDQASDWNSGVQQSGQNAAHPDIHGHKSHGETNSADVHSSESNIASKSFLKRRSISALKHASVQVNVLKTHARTLRRTLSQNPRALLSPVDQQRANEDDSSDTRAKSAASQKSSPLIPGQDQKSYSEKAPTSSSTVPYGVDSTAPGLLPNRTSLSSLLGHFPQPPKVENGRYLNDTLVGPKSNTNMHIHPALREEAAANAQATPNENELVYQGLNELLHKYPHLEPEINLITRNMRNWEASTILSHTIERDRWANQMLRCRYEHDYTKHLLAESEKKLKESVEMGKSYRGAVEAEQKSFAVRQENAELQVINVEGATRARTQDRGEYQSRFNTEITGDNRVNKETMSEDATNGAQVMTNNGTNEVDEDPGLKAVKRSREMAKRLEAQSLENRAFRKHKRSRPYEERKNTAPSNINPSDMSDVANTTYYPPDRNASSVDIFEDAEFLQELVNSRMPSAAPPPTTFTVIRTAARKSSGTPDRRMGSSGSHGHGGSRPGNPGTFNQVDGSTARRAGSSGRDSSHTFNQEDGTTARRVVSSGQGNYGNGDPVSIRRGFSSKSGKSQYPSAVLNQVFNEMSSHENDGHFGKTGDH